MKKSNQENFIIMITMTVLTTALLVSAPIVVMAGQPNTGINGGQFTDFNTLTWTNNDGTDMTYGRGPVFSEVHPEITDAEYYLKEAVLYPGEAIGSLNSQEKPKANYPEQSVNAIRDFLNSFDWIHSDELARAEKVYNRIALGYNKNSYGFGDSSVNFTVLETGTGICGDFAREYTMLAKFVGLECEVYTPSADHEACLIELNGHWFSLDPTSGTPIYSNNTTYPVDYETEKNRYALESDAKWEKYKAENPDSWAVKLDELDKRLAVGEITAEEYNTIWEQIK